MRNWLKMILPIAFAGAAWSAPAACLAGTYASYQALGSGGCTVGDEIFSNFGGLTFTNSLGVDQITTSELFITPSVVAGVDELLFTYQNLPTGFGGFPSSTDVGVGGSQIFSYSFQYIVTPSPNPLADVQMKSTILNTGSGSVSAVKDVDSNATESSANDGGAPHTSFTGVNGPVTAVGFGGPYTVQDTVSLQGQSGTAEQQDFTNLFTEGSVSTSTPEPSTTLLIATGLICFGITRRFRASS